MAFSPGFNFGASSFGGSNTAGFSGFSGGTSGIGSGFGGGFQASTPSTSGFNFGAATSSFPSSFGGNTAASGFGFSSTPQQQQQPSFNTGGGGGGFNLGSFGSSSSFGSNTSSFGSFGSGTGSFSQPNTNAPYKPTTTPENDTYHHICKMNEYVLVTPEELRWDDYKKGIKGATGGMGAGISSPAFTGFGGNTGGFGGNTGFNSGFGATSTGFGTTTGFGGGAASSGFGTSFTTGFGTSLGTGFGANTGFGAGATGSTGFGTSGGFGASSPSFSFGNNNNTNASSGFNFGGGSTSSPGLSFGNNNASSTFSFGGNTGSSFGSSFASAATTGFSFNSAQPASGTGSTPGFAFGSSVSSPSSGSSFSFAAPSGSSSFQSGFSFGNSSPTSGFSFAGVGGASSSFSFNQSSAPGFFSGSSPSFSFSQPQNNYLSANPVQNQPEITLTSEPYGRLPVFFENPGNIGSSTVTPATPAMPSAKKIPSRVSTPVYRVTPVSTLKTRIQKVPQKEKLEVDSVADLFRSRKNVKKLVTGTASASPLIQRSHLDRVNIPNTPSVLPHSLSEGRPSDYSDQTPIIPKTGASVRESDSLLVELPRPTADLEKDLLPSFDVKEGYFVKPTLEYLTTLTSYELQQVENFEVGREGFGSIRYLEPVDVRSLDINSIVNFSERTVEVYSDETKKPPVGEGLNKRAEISLLQCWPVIKPENTPLKDAASLQRFEETLKSRCARKNTPFISYNPNTGEWKFRVEHFSKYGLDDSDDEDDENNKKMKDVQPKPPSKDMTHPSGVPPNTNTTLITSTTGQVNTIQQPMDTGAPPHPLQTKTTNVDLDIEDEDAYSAEFSSVDENSEDFATPVHLSQQMGLDLPRMLEMAAVGNLFTKKSKPVVQPLKTNTPAPVITEKGFAPLGKLMPTLNLYTSSSSLPFPVPLAQSVVQLYRGKQFPVIDHGLAFGRSFRASFGHEGVMVSPNSSHLKLHPIKTANTNEKFLSILNPHKRLAINRNQTGLLPHYVVPEAQLDEYIHQNGSELINEPVVYQAWTLVQALFSKRGRLSEPADHHFRIVAFDKWLQTVVGNSEKLETQPSDMGEKLDFIFDCLTKNRKQDVLDLYLSDISLSKDSVDPRDFRFLTLIAQAGNRNPAFSAAIQEQLTLWEKDPTLPRTPYYQKRKRIYELLGGDLDSTCDSLEWKCSLGNRLWYSSTPPPEHLSQPFQEYIDAVKRGSAQRPFPAYITNKKRNVVNLEVTDILFNIVQYYCDNESINLDEVLRIDSWSADPLDYRLSWTLFNALNLLTVNNYNSLNSELSCGFSSQLELCGLWEWSIYVILTQPSSVNNDMYRATAIQNMLDRYVGDLVLHPEKERFLVDIGIPKTWISISKANYAHSNRQYDQELAYLFESEQFGRAHSLIFDHFTPLFAPMHPQRGELFESLRKIEAHVNSTRGMCTFVQDWKNGGEILLGVFYLKHASTSSLVPKVMELADRIKELSFPVLEPRFTSTSSPDLENLQTLIATELLQLLSSVSVHKNVLDEKIHLLHTLPLPEDFRRALLNDTVKHIKGIGDTYY